jgi:hypothetical protein
MSMRSSTRAAYEVYVGKRLDASRGREQQAQAQVVCQVREPRAGRQDRQGRRVLATPYLMNKRKFSFVYYLAWTKI